jgi:integrase
VEPSSACAIPAAGITFTVEEVAAMVCSTPSLWWRAFIELSVCTGLRVDEMLRLHTSDIDERTLSVRITSDPTDDDGDGEHATLRRWLPPYQERSVPVDAAVMRTLARLRSEHPDHSYVFVPDWMLDELWTRLAAEEPLAPNQLCPRLGAWFAMIQRRARVTLARERNAPLAATGWPRRTIHALRTTALLRLSACMRPEQLAEHAGNASAYSVRSFYASTRGDARD